MPDGSIRIDAELDTKSFEAQIKQLEFTLDDLEETYKQALEHPEGWDDKSIKELEKDIERTRNKIIDLRENQRKLNEETNRVDFSKWTRQLTRVGMAMLGVRGTMALIRKASSAYLQQNEGTAQKLQAVWVALGNIIGPIIELIANGILKIIGYLNVFVKTLSGGKIDLTKGMGQNSKAIGGTTKAMKELNKQMASFDEMNVLSDNSNAGGGSAGGVGGAGFEMPELDEKIVKRLKDMAEWLKKNWKWLSKVALAVAGLIGVAKLGTGLAGLSGILGAIAKIGIIAIGVDLFYKALTGRDLVKDIQDIYNGLKELEQAKKEQEKVDDELHGKYVQSLNDRKEEAKQYKKNSQEVAQYTGMLKSNIEMSLVDMATHDKKSKTYKRAEEEVKANVKAYSELYKQGKLNDEQAKTYTQTMLTLGYSANGTKLKTEEYRLVLKQLGFNEKEINDILTNNINKEQLLKQKLQEVNGVMDNSKTKTKTLADSLAELARKPHNIIVETVFGDPDTSKLSNAINKIKNSLNIVFNAIGGKVKMAKGGIVNNPGRGVPIGNNIIAGESGSEWIQPLDDPSSLQLIGESIGKYVTVNTSITNTMNGRVISRELQRVQNDSDFAYNR